MVESVLMSDMSKYGVVDCNGNELKTGEYCPIARMVEKPAIEDAPSNLAVVGRYVLSHNIWDKLAMTPPGAGDEIQLTDAIDILMQDETVETFHMTARSHDCGDKFGYAKAFVEYGMRDKASGEAFTAYIESLNDTSFTDSLDLTPLSEKIDV